MVVNENNPKIWASLIAPNPNNVTYWVDLTADPHGNIIKFYDNNDREWYNLTSPTSDYAVYPYIGPNGNWFIENRDSGVSAQGGVPNATINGHRIADNPVLTKEDIGLGNVANLTPEDMPISSATAIELNALETDLVRLNSDIDELVTLKEDKASKQIISEVRYAALVESGEILPDVLYYTYEE